MTWDQTLGQYVAAWHTRKGSRAHKVDKRKVLGKFGADEEAAARAYDQAARADYRAAGGSAQKPQLNFPDTAAGELGPGPIILGQENVFWGTRTERPMRMLLSRYYEGIYLCRRVSYNILCSDPETMSTGWD